MEILKTLKLKSFLVCAFLVVLSLFAVENADASINIYPYNNYNGVRQLGSGGETKLNLSAYDTNGYYLTYSWSCTGGTLSDYNAINPVYTAPTISYENTYICTLSVFNARGERASYDVNILVNGKNNYYYNNDTTNLSVNLTASQSYGVGSLNNVTLTANVIGSNNQGLAYMFNCNDDNVWETRVQTMNTTYVASNLCNYSNPGTYTARVRVESGNYSAEKTVSINVIANPIVVSEPIKTVIVPAPVTTTVKTTSVTSQRSTIVLETLARNITNNEVIWQNEIYANNGDQLEFNIIVTPTGKDSLQNVVVRNILSGDIDSVSDIKVGEIPYSGSIDSINVGTVELGTSKVINFKAKINTNKLNYNVSKIINTSEASASNASITKKDLTINLAANSQVASVSDFTSKAVGVYLAISTIIFLAMLVIIFYLLIERKRMVAEPVKIEDGAAKSDDVKINKSKYFVINS